MSLHVQVRADLKTAQTELQQWQQDAHQSAAKVASVSADTKSLAAELTQRDQEIAALKVAVDTESMSVQHLSGKLDARCAVSYTHLTLPTILLV